MGIAHICQVLSFEIAGVFSASKAEAYYDTNIQPLFSFLYSNPEYRVSVFVSGSLLSWLEQFHPEMPVVFTELAKRRQIEFVGSGHTDPLFPLLLPIDRMGQIERETFLLRKLTGKKPRGILPACGCWDHSLIPNIKMSGMDYVLLDSSIIAKNPQKRFAGFRPHIVEETGKAVTLVPYHRSSFSEAGALDEFAEQAALQQYDLLAVEMLMPAEFLERVENRSCAALLKRVLGSEPFRIDTVSLALKAGVGYIPSCIPTGFKGKPVHVRESIMENPEIRALYSRMIDLSLSINQFRGDKPRKSAAREELWKAQDYKAYVSDGFSLETVHSLRQSAYRHLLAAEKIMQGFDSSVPGACFSYDFDSDGLREYMGRFLEYNAFVHVRGAQVFEFDVRDSCQVYTLTVPVNGEEQVRKIFSDSFYDDEEFDQFQGGKLPQKKPSQRILFEETAFARSKRDILFTGHGRAGKRNQPFTLKKRYIFSDAGIQVQYIVRNDSPRTLEGWFVVQSAIALPHSETDGRTIEVIANEMKIRPDFDRTYCKRNDVSCVQVSDGASEVSFIFEVNENASLQLEPLFVDGKCVATSVSFYWKLSVQSGYEVEKTLFLNVRTPDKALLLKKKPRKKK